VTLTVMILRAGLRLPGHRDRPDGPRRTKADPGPLREAGVSLLSDRPGCACPGAGPVAVSQPAAARQSRGHVTPACAGRVFKARVAQIGTIAQADWRQYLR
jgi:hypothetical protein